MRRAPWLVLAAIALIASTAGVRGDQPPDSPKASQTDKSTDTGDSEGDDRLSAMGRLAHLASNGRLDKMINKARARRLAQLHADDSLDTALGGDDDDDSPAPGGQAETSIAVDATGSHVVIGYNDTRGFALNPLRVSGVMYSDDGGATFIDGGQLPVTTGTTTIGTTVYPQVFGDPDVKYLGGSNFIYFSIMMKKFSTSGTAQTMCFHRSTDNGHTWQGPFEIAPATNPNGLSSTSAGITSARDAADKEFASVDPDTGRVLMSWSNFTSTAIAPGGIEISTTFSDNVFDPTPSWSPRVKVAATAADGQASQPFFAGNGSPNVYVVWRRFSTSGTQAQFFGNGQNVGFALSTDNGVTFGPAGSLTSLFFTSDEALGNDRRNTSPSIAVDNSTGPNKGTIYVVYANNNSNDGSDIMLQRSSDGGQTFTPPLALDARPGNDRSQWFPWTTVDTTTGRVYVFYYDQRIPMGDLTEVSVQYSDDGGTTWSTAMALSDRPFHAAYGNDTGQPNLGDYNQAVAQGGELFAVWAGTTPVGFTDGEPTSLNLNTPDLVFKRLPASSTRVSLQIPTWAIAIADGNNDAIDPGDAVALTIPLSNYATNPLFATPLTGVSATLTTSTAGVSVVQGTKTYPDIAAGAVATNASPFAVQIDKAFVPGTHIEFVLAVAAAQGSATLPFTQSTGTPVATTIFSENFDGVQPGAFPLGWSTSHGGGANVVPWTTSATKLGTASNMAFHQNANDGANGTGNPTRFERLFSPVIAIPAGAEYVTLDFDVAYDTEDDRYNYGTTQSPQVFNVLAYDGFLLRITDLTPGDLARSVQIESFAEEFTTGDTQFYPKKMPRNSSTAYLQDLSAWAGFSNGFKHVHLKLPGMAGATVQLRWEYTQDSGGTCSDVRPGHTGCGVGFDNIVMASVVSASTVTTATGVSSSQNPSDSGAPVTFTASVTAGSAVGDGTVAFREGATVLAQDVPLDNAGHASFTTSSLAAGQHTISADYSGTAPFAKSSGSVVQSVDPIPSLSIDDVTVVEGNTGITQAVFTVNLTKATNFVTASVDFSTADGTAKVSDNDYIIAGGTLFFAPGETTKTIAVAVNGDFVVEPNGTFFVNLSHAAGATIADGQGVGTIVNDDTASTTLDALAAQVASCAGGLNAGQCQALLTRIVAAQLELAAGRTSSAIGALAQFLNEVQNDSRGLPGNGSPPRLDGGAAAVLMTEAQSIIAVLSQ